MSTSHTISRKSARIITKSRICLRYLIKHNGRFITKRAFSNLGSRQAEVSDVDPKKLAFINASKKQKIRDQLRAWMRSEEYAEKLLPVENITHNPANLPVLPGAAHMFGSRVDNANNESADFETLSENEDEPFHPARATPEMLNEVEESLQVFDQFIAFDPQTGFTEQPAQYNAGDLFEFRWLGRYSILALMLGLSRSGDFFFLTANGALVERGLHSPVIFHQPKFCTPAEVESLVRHLPSVSLEDLEGHKSQHGSVDILPRDLVAPLVKKMRDFDIETEEIGRKHTDGWIATLLRLHTGHERGSKRISLEALAATFLESQTAASRPAALRAVNLALIKRRYGFLYDERTYASSRVLAIDTLRNKTALVNLRQLVRIFSSKKANQLLKVGAPEEAREGTPSHTLTAFIRKARILINYSRATRRSSPEGYVITGRRKEKKNAEMVALKEAAGKVKFSETEKAIIRAMKLCLTHGSFSYHPSLAISPYVIIRETGMHDGFEEWGDSLIWTFLVELGVLDPFTAAISFDLKGQGSHSQLQEASDAVVADIKSGSAVDEAAGLVDSMSHMRKDWGDGQVFTIDAHYTTEIDDGLSVENVPEQPDQIWVHMHICHISAFVEPGSLIGQIADAHKETMYNDANNTKQAMLPRWITERFSLGPGKPAITISARLNSNTGEVLESMIQATTLQNVKRITPTALSTLLTSDEPLAPKDNVMDRATITLFKRLFVTAGKLRAQHPRNVYTSFDKKSLIQMTQESEPVPTNDTMIPPVGSESTSKSDPTTSNARHDSQDDDHHHFRADADLKVSVDIAAAGLTSVDKTPGDLVVTETMLLANRLVAEFGARHKIPMAYWGTRISISGTEAFAASLREDIRAAGGAVTKDVKIHARRNYATRFISSAPVAHRLMGFDMYTKVTSPLRRFWDLMSLWNVDAALRWEAARPRDKSGNSESRVTRPWWPLSKSRVDYLIRDGQERSRMMQFYARQQMKHVQTMAMMRSHYLGEGGLKLPDRLIMGVRIVHADSWGGPLENFVETAISAPRNAKNMAVVKKLGYEPEAGDSWEVKIHRFHLDPNGTARHKITAELVRRIAHGEQLLASKRAAGHEPGSLARNAGEQKPRERNIVRYLNGHGSVA